MDNGVKLALQILTLGKDILRNPAMINAIFSSDEVTDAQKVQIRVMRASLESLWDSLAPK